MSRRRSIPGLVVGICLSWAAIAQADAVTYWNEVALTAVSAPNGRGGPVGFLDVALVQAGVHDAVQSIERRYQPYRVRVRQASGAPYAAVAGAAHRILLGLYPAQAAFLDERMQNFLATNAWLDPADPGFLVGQEVGASIMSEYRAAPTPPLPNYLGGDAPGDWRPTPSYNTPQAPAPFSPGAFEFTAYLKPFTLRRASQFRPAPPPRLTSARYRRDYDEVKAYGSLTNSLRNDEQERIARFWSDNFVTQLNRALRDISQRYVWDTGDNARLFALASLSVADAFISCWDAKYHYSFWRPVTAIIEGENDGNRRTVGDPDWRPFLNTPNYPDYSSGANNAAAAMMTAVRLFFGTNDVGFTITSNSALVTDPGERTRYYARPSDVMAEVVEVRILQGIHFRTADEVARDQGARVARWVYQRFLRPTRR